MDVEFAVSSKKSSMPKPDLKAIIDQATVPQGVRMSHICIQHVIVMSSWIIHQLEILGRITLCVDDPGLLHVAQVNEGVGQGGGAQLLFIFIDIFCFCQGLPGLSAYQITAIKTGNAKVFQFIKSAVTWLFLAVTWLFLAAATYSHEHFLIHFLIQACCANITTDILALELGERMDFTIKRSQVTQVEKLCFVMWLLLYQRLFSDPW